MRRLAGNRKAQRVTRSMSLPASVMSTVPSSLTVADPAIADGASLTGLTVSDTSAGAELAVPSFTVK